MAVCLTLPKNSQLHLCPWPIDSIWSQESGTISPWVRTWQPPLYRVKQKGLADPKNTECAHPSYIYWGKTHRHYVSQHLPVTNPLSIDFGDMWVTLANDVTENGPTYTCTSYVYIEKPILGSITDIVFSQPGLEWRPGYVRNLLVTRR